ncbi:recombinase family protein [Actinopolyspora halophila]|uniref:recombinase family protein n=1 Tax=Actinopolyspora halophila TaxID=1850 RepID=UPI0003A49ED2|nr:recombinase family protein [Actinopolyspora halophila]
MSTADQSLPRQVDALTNAGCLRVFEEKLSGKNAERPELAACLDYLHEGDPLVVLELSRLGRSLVDLLPLVSGLRQRGIGFTSLHENLDTTTSGGRLVFHVFAALTEFIRELIADGTREGLAAARANGRPTRPTTGHDPRTDPPRPRPARRARHHLRAKRCFLRARYRNARQRRRQLSRGGRVRGSYTTVGKRVACARRPASMITA